MKEGNDELKFREKNGAAIFYWSLTLKTDCFKSWLINLLWSNLVLIQWIHYATSKIIQSF